jgi:hypothetical protein
MSEDRLLNELGDLARRETEAEQARFDERWDRLAAGTLSADEDAELRALAAASPEAREAYEAFRPLGGEIQARVVAALAAELAPAAEEPPARVLPFRRAATRGGAWLAAAAAMAAGLFFLLRPGVPPLPQYLPPELSGGAQVLRSAEPAASNVFGPGAFLTLAVRPRRQVAGPVEAHAFFGPAGTGGEILPLPPDPEVAPTGVVRLQGTVGQEIRMPAGAWRIWIVAGRPGKLPSVDGLTAALRRGETRGAAWQAVAADVRIESASP